MNDWLRVTRGDTPLIVSMPHVGTRIPAPFDAGLIDPHAATRDADWHIDRLYVFAAETGATLIATDISRTVIDLNRDPAEVSLYPGQATTGLVPTTHFDGSPLYRAGAEPTDVAARRASYYDPYHAALSEEIARLRAAHPAIVLYDAHSILSRVPRLFEGELPQFNIGTNSGASCAPALADAVFDACPEPKVRDGRFKGGWITRNYGAPARGVHAIQMELAIRGYADESAPEVWDAARAAPMQATLRTILSAALDFAKGCP
ncbi:N-formylglutamate deformylase [Sphingomonas donggukensis]|uniref:N-formylglutamate deformylase n=1 Tax=Sphingomonas donggukensis TaxID=2949093 RepID=A0ABY4TSM5_9SPHN|nr:N-formylglutamate deformylase [Sphingomonas donggukensis]URW75395.1 N-formylglutamate deformylase [Sphingomonas donggukensis]